jgi:NADH-quinone oxidoreductase subunit M
MNLSLLVLVPLVTAFAIIPCKGIKQVRAVSLLGALMQLALGITLLIFFWQERGAGNTAAMLFESNYSWFKPLNINYHIGVDGISIAMILLTSFVVVAGILVSWSIESPVRPVIRAGMGKEFFFLASFS